MRRLILGIAFMVGGCAVGPNFRSPTVELEPRYVNSVDTALSADLARWWRSMGDATLDSLMQRAFANNRDLRSAVKSVEIARLGIASAKALALPSLTLGADVGAKQGVPVTGSYTVMPTISWEVDLWGKIRRQAEAAGADFHVSEYQAAAIMQNLAAEVATTYFSTCSYRDALHVATTTYLSRLRSQTLMDSMFRYGAISEVDLKQAFASTATANAAVEQYSRAYKSALLSLNLLLGDYPNDVILSDTPPTLTPIGAGVPSSLLERRADVMQAYFGLQKANAMIGVAIAERLPSISLTGSGGLAASIINDAATGRPLAWSASASLLAPILNWGTLKRNERIARIETEQALLAYEQSVLTAISDVETALVAVDTYNGQVRSLASVVEASSRAQMLSDALYRAGEASYLDVLDADRSLFSAELSYIDAVNNRISAYITLYKALGGGW